MEVQKQIGEQVRGMKVRSSVKKLCEGCKVCLNSIFKKLLGMSQIRELQENLALCSIGEDLVGFVMFMALDFMKRMRTNFCNNRAYEGKEERRALDMCISFVR